MTVIMFYLKALLGLVSAVLSLAWMLQARGAAHSAHPQSQSYRHAYFALIC